MTPEHRLWQKQFMQGSSCRRLLNQVVYELRGRNGWKRNRCLRRLHRGRRKIQHTDHLFDRLNSSDRLLRKGKRKRDGSDKTSINKYRAATHAGDNAGTLQRTTGQSRKNHVLLRSDGVFEDAKNLDVEL